jgi:hypothetical protein
MAAYILAGIVLVPTVLIAVVVAVRAWQQGSRLKGVFAPPAILAAGSAGAWFAFTTTRDMEVTTLHEVMLEGTLGVKEGEPCPVRETSFRAEHPGAEHELFFSPSGSRQDFTAKVAVKLLDPAGAVVLEEEYTFEPRKEGGRTWSWRWQGRKLYFRPEQEATYRLLVTPLTLGIEGVHVRIADPEKTDGQRMPGY